MARSLSESPYHTSLPPLPESPPPFHSRPGMSIPMDHHSEGLQMANSHRHTWKQQIERSPSRHQLKRIDVLPDDVLLGIFDFRIIMNPSLEMEMKAWQTLVHVCRRWRNLVFASPRRLNLRVGCTRKTMAWELDIWPALPLVIHGYITLSGTGNIVTALRQSNRVRQVYLADLAPWHLEEILAPMQVSFPDLTDLRLWSSHTTVSVTPDSFLGGSAPRLQSLELGGIPFLGLPKLLLTTTHLVCLDLRDIPPSGYISPEAMVAPLSVLSSLRTLHLGFRSPGSRPDLESQSLPPPERSILPALNKFYFNGDTEYLEVLVTFIDAPQLDLMHIMFLNQIHFGTPRLAQFINRAPKLKKRDAHVKFFDIGPSILLPHDPRYLALPRYPSVLLPHEPRCLDLPQTRFSYVILPHERRCLDLPGYLTIRTFCREPDLQLSSIVQICNSFLRPTSTVEDLYIKLEYSERVWKNDAVENTLWLQLLLPFTGVKNLYLYKEFVPGIAAALQGLVEGRITEMLPNLQNIFVEGFQVEPSGSLQENLSQFADARRKSGHPIAISDWGTNPPT